jgi:hypothetical protein
MCARLQMPARGRRRGCVDATVSRLWIRRMSRSGNGRLGPPLRRSRDGGGRYRRRRICLRFRRGRRGRCRWRHRVSGGRRRRRQEQQRVEVTLRLVGAPDAEVNVRQVVLDDAARPDRSDRTSLGHGVTAHDHDRTEVGQRHGVPVVRLDRDGVPAARD